VLQFGVNDGMCVDIQKRVRLCNLLALWGASIMAPWVAIEALFGDPRNFPPEVASLAGFLAVLVLNASRANRVARMTLIATANAAVLAGALIYEKSSGGVLPFFSLVGLPLLLFGPGEWRMVAVGVALPPLLFALCDSGIARHLLAFHPLPTPPWWFAANVVSAFAVAFVVPFFFYRSNLRAEALLERMGREKLKRVIDSNLIGVVRGRLSGCIEDANDTFLAMLGYTRSDLTTGALDLKCIAPLDPLGCGHALLDLPRRGAHLVYERTFAGKDGSAVPALVGVALLDESHDEVVGFVLDLSAQKRLEAEKAMLRESQEALRLRDLFNSIASHELKTPLAALLLNLQTLRRRLERDTPTDSPLRSKVERCESSASRMGELIHALLDVAQIHDGKLKLSLHEMDVVDAVRKTVSAFELSRPGACPIEVRADGAVTACLDSLRFDQVLTNLLSNAVKYGAGKPIEVHVARDRATDLARLEVIDHGPGIEPGMSEKIFEPFQRAASSEPIPGLGLGLYVVKMIVEGHGGHVNVESCPGQGSRFVVDLPCAAVPCAPTQPSTQPSVTGNA
jgi:signal transduction histidine kinase